MSCVGIVYGPNNSPLYCVEDGDKYWVINGAWSFTKKSKRIRGKRGLEWRVVLPEMEDYGDYNEACEIIMKAAESS